MKILISNDPSAQQKTSTTVSRRGDAKYSTLTDTLRNKIVDGVWMTGEKLPTWDEMCAAYRVGRPTLTRALSALKNEGFVSADSTRGTYVTEIPPHRNTFVMIFPSAPGRQGIGGWNLFWESLAMNAFARTSNGGPKVEVRFEVSPHSDCAPYARLMEDIAKRRIAGVLIVNGGELIRLKLPDTIPHLHICGGTPPGDKPAIGVDWPSFYEQAATLMKAQGRFKVAVLSEHDSASEACAQALARHDLNVPEHWRLSMPGTHAEGARNLTRLLLARSAAERPDGLIITDDNLVPCALSGALEERIAIPADLVVIAHGNIPASRTPSPAIHRLGFDTKQMLQTALEILVRQRETGTQAPLTTAIPARLDA